MTFTSSPSTTPIITAPLPSTPDPTTAGLWYETIQGVLVILGALGVGVPAALQSPQVELQIAGALAVLTGVAMSWIDRFRGAAKAHLSAVASAKAGRAVRVV